MNPKNAVTAFHLLCTACATVVVAWGYVDLYKMVRS